MKVLRNKRGQALVEFALILPLLMLILLGIVEFALILSNQLILENAAREGSRYAVLGATDAEVRVYLLELTEPLSGADPTLVISPSTASRLKGVAVTVGLTYQHNLMTPIISNIVGGQIQLSAAATMRME